MAPLSRQYMVHKLAGFLVSVLVLTDLAGALQLITETPSSFTASSPNTPKFVVTLQDTLDDAAARSALQGSRPGGYTMVMTAADGQRYSCTLPDPALLSQQTASEESALATTTDLQEEQQQQQPTTTKTPFELLESLTALCLYRQEGLWTYEMCYKRHVRQFRQAGGGQNEDFSCGNFKAEDPQSEEIKFDGSTTSIPLTYVSHNMSGGAPCVMTGDGRTAEVRFTCMPDITDNLLVSVKEFPTCNYVLIVATPFLCKHPAFKHEPEKHHSISCIPEGKAAQAGVLARKPAKARHSGKSTDAKGAEAEGSSSEGQAPTDQTKNGMEQQEAAEQVQQQVESKAQDVSGQQEQPTMDGSEQEVSGEEKVVGENDQVKEEL